VGGGTTWLRVEGLVSFVLRILDFLHGTWSCRTLHNKNDTPESAGVG
jgi:hypothetical protein